MKTLYISDLDGTLLTPEPRLTPFTRSTLNELRRTRGLHFSVATARTAATVDVLLEGLETGAPCVLMNGACVYDLSERRYLRVETFPVSAILPVLRAHGLAGFAFAVRGGALVTCYERVGSEASRVYMEDRIRGYRKRFTQVSDLAELGDIAYYSFTDRRERLDAAYEALRALPGIRVEYYADVYHPENHYLEVASAAASKANAAAWIRERCGFDRIVAFGDNVNDLPLFALADESCAVANARAEVRARASRVIGANTEDGVARWIASRLAEVRP